MAQARSIVVAAGRIDALGRLYDLTGPVVFQLSTARLDGDQLAAEVVTQQVFLRIWTLAGTYDGP